MRTLLALALLLLGSPVSYADSKPFWEEISRMPEGRSGMVAYCTEDAEPAFLGGSSWSDGEKRVHESGYVLRENQWRPLSLLPFPVAYASVTTGLHSFTICGGANGPGINPQLVIQKPNSPRQIFPLPTSQARIYAGAANLQGSFYQIGGATQISPLNPTNSISRLRDGSWTDLGVLPEGALINPAVTAWDNEIYVFGGGIPSANGLKNTGSVFAFDVKNRSWSKWSSLPTATRGTVAIPLPDLGVLLIGGYADSKRFSRQALLYVPEKDAFSPLPELPIGLMLPGVVLAGPQIYVFGGEDAPQSRSMRVFRADLHRLLPHRNSSP